MSSPSVGAHLRRLREGRGVSLEEIARATRVSSGYLHALEADDFASLPVPVFTRGFIRAYCQTLGEAAEPALGLYDARSDPTPAMAEASAVAPCVEPDRGRVGADTEKPRTAAHQLRSSRGARHRVVRGHADAAVGP
jgi:cytoskeletal protein RodZ